MAAVDQTQVVYRLLASLSQLNEKVVISSKFCQVLTVIKDICSQQNWKCVLLDGKCVETNVKPDTPARPPQGLTTASPRLLHIRRITQAHRKPMIDAFNSANSQTFVMLLSQKVGGEGISLIGASRLIVLEPDHNPAKDIQLCGRLWRPGQKKRVFTYRLLSSGTLEELIYQRQHSKMELGQSVDIGDNEFSVDVSDRTALISLDTKTWSSTFKDLEPQCLTTPDRLGIELEGAVSSGSVSHIHVNESAASSK